MNPRMPPIHFPNAMVLFVDFYVALYVITNLGEITLHACSILLVDNLQQLFQLGTNLGHLVVGIGVEEDFLQQVVILVEYTLGNTHVALESSSKVYS